MAVLAVLYVIGLVAAPLGIMGSDRARALHPAWWVCIVLFWFLLLIAYHISVALDSE